MFEFEMEQDQWGYVPYSQEEQERMRNFRSGLNCDCRTVLEKCVIEETLINEDDFSIQEMEDGDLECQCVECGEVHWISNPESPRFLLEKSEILIRYGATPARAFDLAEINQRTWAGRVAFAALRDTACGEYRWSPSPYWNLTEAASNGAYIHEDIFAWIEMAMEHLEESAHTLG